MVDLTRLNELSGETPLLSRLCTRNGWPDGDTLRLGVLEEGAAGLRCGVTPKEIVRESVGCTADRFGCWGRLRVERDGGGTARGCGVESGKPHGP